MARIVWMKGDSLALILFQANEVPKFSGQNQGSALSYASLPQLADFFCGYLVTVRPLNSYLHDI